MADSNLHRNNAAEWLLFFVLCPLVPIVLLIQQLRPKRGGISNDQTSRH